LHVRLLEKPVCFKIEPMSHTRLREMDQQGRIAGAKPESFLPMNCLESCAKSHLHPISDELAFEPKWLPCDRPGRSLLHDVR
jgi:hypothetical protein